jgi:hypothetical protein
MDSLPNINNFDDDLIFLVDDGSEPTIQGFDTEEDLREVWKSTEPKRDPRVTRVPLSHLLIMEEMLGDTLRRQGSPYKIPSPSGLPTSTWLAVMLGSDDKAHTAAVEAASEADIERWVRSQGALLTSALSEFDLTETISLMRK